jgi:hypothetical protein
MMDQEIIGIFMRDDDLDGLVLFSFLLLPRRKIWGKSERDPRSESDGVLR